MIDEPTILRYTRLRKGHLDADPAGQAGGTRKVRGNPRSERCMKMAIVAVFALLALFSLISLTLSGEEPRGYNDPHDNPLLWATLGRR